MWSWIWWLWWHFEDKSYDDGEFDENYDDDDFDENYDDDYLDENYDDDDVFRTSLCEGAAGAVGLSALSLVKRFNISLYSGDLGGDCDDHDDYHDYDEY